MGLLGQGSQPGAPICWDPAGGGVGLICGGGGVGVRCQSTVGRADPPESRQRKPFALELSDAENKGALGVGLQGALAVPEQWWSWWSEVGGLWDPVKVPCLAQEPLWAWQAMPGQ